MWKTTIYDLPLKVITIPSGAKQGLVSSTIPWYETLHLKIWITTLALHLIRPDIRPVDGKPVCCFISVVKGYTWENKILITKYFSLNSVRNHSRNTTMFNKESTACFEWVHAGSWRSCFPRCWWWENSLLWFTMLIVRHERSGST